MKQIDPSSLIDLKGEADRQGVPLRTRLVYAGNDNFLGEAVYKPDAKLWLHKSLARVVLAAARRATEDYGFYFVATDGLRTVDAQRKMINSKIVRQNPQWVAEKMLLYPGFGGHPRGMAVDIILEDKEGRLLEMGTGLDTFTEKSSRDYIDLPEDVLERRKILEKLMVDAADALKTEIYPLPNEWWDFRLPPEIYKLYYPLSDSDLPPNQQMCPLRDEAA